MELTSSKDLVKHKGYCEALIRSCVLYEARLTAKRAEYRALGIWSVCTHRVMLVPTSENTSG